MATNNTTILYLTDSVMDDYLADRCRWWLLKAAGGLPIVSVSQTSLDLGHNVCVGPLGRSGWSLDRQISEGLKHVATRFTAIAEHDCIYTSQHFRFVPPRTDTFYYNRNFWLVIYDWPKHPELNGLYSRFPRRKYHSQLIADTDLMQAACQLRLQVTSSHAWQARYPRGELTEPGVDRLEIARRLCEPADVAPMWPAVERYVTAYRSEFFDTSVPNLDIRHTQNLRPSKRGRQGTFSLAPWGKFETVIPRRAA